MAEILALGVSHYPPLCGPDERMAYILRRMLQNPKLPPSLREPAGWPESMRAEWGNDEGLSAAGRHRSDLVAALMKASRADFASSSVKGCSTTGIWRSPAISSSVARVMPCRM